ncbi:alpha/beta fold hydrolase [Polaromonas sp. LjRoot131]|uniref:alpha/beta fold hydrolase n=1 Tax=Polaromonas sp. LjRoot131 TaxID=3342262 RepID=UPI003ECCF367
MEHFNHHSGDHLALDSAKIYFEVHGDSTDPPLLFLHGGLGTLRDFNDVLPRLAKRFRVIGIDSRGHGKSTLGTAAMNYQRLALDAAGVLRHLGVERCSVVGFSDGGITALRMAAQADMRVERLVAIGTDKMLKPDDPVRKLLAGVTAESWTKKFPETVALYNALNPQPDFKGLVDAIVPMWLDDSPSGYPGDCVRQISCPLLAIRGDEDHLVSRASVFELVEQVKGAKLLNIPFAGHEAHKDQAEAVMASVNRFLE